MKYHDDVFTPGEVDEQITQISQAGQFQPSDLSKIQVVEALQQAYRATAEADNRSLERVLTSLLQTRNEAAQHSRDTLLVKADSSQETRQPIIANISPRFTGSRPPLRRLETIAAIVFLTLLVGGIIGVLQLAHQSKTGNAGLASSSGIFVANGNTIYHLDPRSGRVYWHFSTGNSDPLDTINEAPTVVNGHVYFSTQSKYLYALDAVTGKTLWKKAFIPAVKEFFNSSLIVVNGVLYIIASDGYLHAIDADTGNDLWKKLVVTTAPTYLPDPLVANGIVYAVSALDNTLYALNAKDGSQVWSALLRMKMSGQLLIAHMALSDGMISIIPTFGQLENSSSSLITYNAHSGQRLWYVSPLPQPYNSQLEIINQVIYFSSYAPGGGSCGCKDNYVYAYNLSKGSLAWRSEEFSDSILEPTVDNGIVYIDSQNGYTYALNTQTGKTLWSYNAGERMTDPPVVDRGIVYIGATSGGSPSNHNYLIALNPGGTKRWQTVVSGYIGIAPYIVDKGTLYVGSADESVYALRISDGKVLWRQNVKSNPDFLGGPPLGPQVTVGP